MNPFTDPSATENGFVQYQTRRHFFQDCALGVGKIALASMLCQGALRANQPRSSRASDPLAPQDPHFPPKVKNVIYLFMAGGPSQLELFDYKPELQRRNGQEIPRSYLEGRRFAFMNSFTRNVPKLLGARRSFRRHGQSGAWMSELLPHTGSIADEIAILPTIQTEVFNHGPAKLFMNTGTNQYGRPSMGAWVTYGIGSEARELPGFVVLQSGPRGPRGGAPLWGSGFLPTVYQGVPFRNSGDPVLNLSSPPGINQRRQGQAIDLISQLNTGRLQKTGDPEIATRISAYEMAYRMQTSAPELIDISRETQATLRSYGAQPGRATFANNCLLARRLVERGVRFVQLYHTDWDHHGGPSADLGGALERVTREVDQPCAALIKDLKQRGMLEDTLVIWGGEFGRTPMGENRQTVGRNHHIDTFTVWMAGGGVKKGVTIGKTDVFGFLPEEDPIHVHDLQATVLHLLGLDHLRLTYRYQARDFRLTDIGGEVVRKVLA